MCNKSDLHIKNLDLVRQVACICEALQQRADIKRLSQLLRSLPSSDAISHSEAVLKAKATVAFHMANFVELYNILENHCFDPSHHQFLQVPMEMSA